MNKKVYEPGEMFHKAFWEHGTSPNNFYKHWTNLSPFDKNLWALREKTMFNQLSQQCKEDEQTDDNPGVPLNDYPFD